MSRAIGVRGVAARHFLVAFSVLIVLLFSSAPVMAGASQTLFVNKYAPAASDTPGCSTAPFTEIGTAWPAPAGAAGAASSGDTIFICGSPDAASDPYRPEVRTGTKDFTFKGDGPEMTIIDGGSTRNPFHANEAGSFLNLESMTIRNGFDVNTGGAVEAGGRTVNVENVHFINNRAVGFGVGGGAIQAEEVNTSNSVFRNNRAERTNPAFDLHKGGAIYAEDTVTLDRNSEFVDNSADGSGGAIFANGNFLIGQELIWVADTVFLGNSTDTGSGGAIYVPGLTSVEGSVFEGNVAGTENTGSGTGDGGAIWSGGRVDVTGTLFEGNSAPGLDRSGVGGAIASAGKITVDSSDFISNQARTYAGALSAGEGVAITDSGFEDNRATGEESFGGAVHSQFGTFSSTIEGSTFVGNSAGGFAGAVRTFGTPLTVINSTFTENQAEGSAAAILSSDDLRLDGVTSSANLGPFVIASSGDLSIGNSIIDETGEACVVAGTRVNRGGNVISNTTAPTADCNPFVGGGGAPENRVPPSAIELMSLADNGGPTQTLALGLGSVARSSADLNCLETDQRGVARPSTDCSSGAYQLLTENLTVSKTGPGTGMVSSSPAGITCGPGCFSQVAEFARNPPFTTVTLTASAEPGSAFLGWSRTECQGTGPCEVPLDQAREVTANFVLTYELSVTKSGTGNGTVTSDPEAIDCGPSCRGQFLQGTEVNLSASPGPDSTFTGFSGACSGLTCEVTMDQARQVTATFAAIPPSGKPKLKVSFSAPKKVKRSKPFTVKVKVANEARPSTGSPGVNGKDPTGATGLKSCLTLPRTVNRIKARGAKVRGRQICWSKSSLPARSRVVYTIRLKVAGTSAGRKARSVTLGVSASARNSEGGTVKASGRRKVRLT